MSVITRHTDTITQIKVPLSFPLRWVNSYLIRGSNGYTLIDPGLHTQESEACWADTMKEMKITFKDIEQVVLTHHHPDHYGLSGWFQAQSNAPVYLSEPSNQLVIRLWGEQQTLTQELHLFFLRHGMDPSLAVQMIPHMDSFIPLVSPQPQITVINEGNQIRLGDTDYRCILTSGHATGHLCFYNATSQIMFCGDQVIPQISPNVSYIPNHDPNPLLSFMDSLELLTHYEVSKAYPGHRDPFDTFAARVEEIIEHHEQRLIKITNLLEHPITAFEMCNLLFGNKLPIHQLRFAMGETIAHLVYLVHNKTAFKHEHNGVILFQQKLKKLKK